MQKDEAQEASTNVWRKRMSKRNGSVKHFERVSSCVSHCHRYHRLPECTYVCCVRLSITCYSSKGYVPCLLSTLAFGPSHSARSRFIARGSPPIDGAARKYTTCLVCVTLNPLAYEKFNAAAVRQPSPTPPTSSPSAKHNITRQCRFSHSERSPFILHTHSHKNTAKEREWQTGVAYSRSRDGWNGEKCGRFRRHLIIVVAWKSF